jgi:translation elongation factor EF-G
MGDLNGRRGRIAGMDTRGVMTIIKAQVPMSEMLTYEQHLTSATGGRGTYHMEHRTTTKCRRTCRRRSSPRRGRARGVEVEEV